MPYLQNKLNYITQIINNIIVNIEHNNRVTQATNDTILNLYYDDNTNVYDLIEEYTEDEQHGNTIQQIRHEFTKILHYTEVDNSEDYTPHILQHLYNVRNILKQLTY